MSLQKQIVLELVIIVLQNSKFMNHKNDHFRRSMMKKLLSVITILFMTSIFFNATPFNLTASAAKEYYHANYGIYYIVTNNYVKITGCDSTDERIVLPSKLQNKKVSYIAKGAFKDNTTMKKIQINSSSMRIEAEAFSGCTALEQVQMRTDNYIAYLGSKAF